jgi:hypothetical protein
MCAVSARRHYVALGRMCADPHFNEPMLYAWKGYWLYLFRAADGETAADLILKQRVSPNHSLAGGPTECCRKQHDFLGLRVCLLFNGFLTKFCDFSLFAD